MSENSSSIFKPKDIIVTLGDKDYRLVYDLNSFCELETIYGSIDEVLKMIIGEKEELPPVITYNDATVRVEEILVDGKPLADILRQKKTRVAKQVDTLNILYAGMLHDCTTWNDKDEITGYTISKTRIASFVTLKNIKEINQKIAIAILQDLVPTEAEVKNEDPPKAPNIVVTSPQQ